MKDTPTFSVLNRGMSIHGDVAADHGITCLGLIDGNLSSSAGLLHVGSGGVVRGKVEGDHVIVDGIVEGDVAARSTLLINGRVKGEIFYAGTIRLGLNANLESRISRVAAIGAGCDAHVFTREAVPASPADPAEPVEANTAGTPST
ncbi:polymer-forming cytoskeletal protein [Cupriavidus sp. CuC1]|uniref:polymer-forming cytoskeletal protein n=1 Tax=Cupriavidus sp. CuC1 TaxID=3373131 RepID=UPI0037D824D1